MPILIEKPEQVSAISIVQTEPQNAKSKESIDWVFYVAIAILVYLLFKPVSGLFTFLLRSSIICFLILGTLIVFVLTG